MTKIPLFPLNMIVLPFEKVPLHIFEDRYKKMISNSIANNSPFGIVSNNKGSVDTIGCTLNVTKIIKHYETGEYDLIATGKKCFQILDKIKKDNLWIGNIEYLQSPVTEQGSLLKSVQNKYLELLIKIGKEKDFELYMDKEISFQFLEGISLPIDIKRNILLLENEMKRLFYVNDLFDKVLAQDIQNSENNLPEA
ncbi:LON peptidase substrate-binding domain-containing protein [Candidatus Marinimicrobia bacterium]|nr:LON peptidase substrate-binding domain-containing protein [Candidatus Neomarinimicrobiota bacterium]